MSETELPNSHEKDSKHASSIIAAAAALEAHRAKVVEDGLETLMMTAAASGHIIDNDNDNEEADNVLSSLSILKPKPTYNTTDLSRLTLIKGKAKLMNEINQINHLASNLNNDDHFEQSAAASFSVKQQLRFVAKKNFYSAVLVAINKEKIQEKVSSSAVLQPKPPTKPKSSAVMINPARSKQAAVVTAAAGNAFHVHHHRRKEGEQDKGEIISLVAKKPAVNKLNHNKKQFQKKFSSYKQQPNQPPQAASDDVSKKDDNQMTGQNNEEPIVERGKRAIFTGQENIEKIMKENDRLIHYQTQQQNYQYCRKSPIPRQQSSTKMHSSMILPTPRPPALRHSQHHHHHQSYNKGKSLKQASHQGKLDVNNAVTKRANNDWDTNPQYKYDDATGLFSTFEDSAKRESQHDWKVAQAIVRQQEKLQELHSLQEDLQRTFDCRQESQFMTHSLQFRHQVDQLSGRSSCQLEDEKTRVEMEERRLRSEYISLQAYHNKGKYSMRNYSVIFGAPRGFTGFSAPDKKQETTSILIAGNEINDDQQTVIVVQQQPGDSSHPIHDEIMMKEDIRNDMQQNQVERMNDDNKRQLSIMEIAKPIFFRRCISTSFIEFKDFLDQLPQHNRASTADTFKRLIENSNRFRGILRTLLVDIGQHVQSIESSGEVASDLIMYDRFFEVISAINKFWHLIQIFSINDQRFISLEFANWLRESTMDVSSYIYSFQNISRPERQSDYWSLLYTLTVQGRLPLVVELLTYHSEIATSLASSSTSNTTSSDQQVVMPRHEVVLFLETILAYPFAAGTSVADNGQTDNANNPATDRQAEDDDTTIMTRSEAFVTWQDRIHRLQDTLGKTSALFLRNPALTVLLHLLAGDSSTLRQVYPHLLTTAASGPAGQGQSEWMYQLLLACYYTYPPSQLGRHSLIQLIQTQHVQAAGGQQPQHDAFEQQLIQEIIVQGNISKVMVLFYEYIQRQTTAVPAMPADQQVAVDQQLLQREMKCMLLQALYHLTRLLVASSRYPELASAPSIQLSQQSLTLKVGSSSNSRAVNVSDSSSSFLQELLYHTIVSLFHLPCQLTIVLAYVDDLSLSSLTGGGGEGSEQQQYYLQDVLCSLLVHRSYSSQQEVWSIVKQLEDHVAHQAKQLLQQDDDSCYRQVICEICVSYASSTLLVQPTQLSAQSLSYLAAAKFYAHAHAWSMVLPILEYTWYQMMQTVYSCLSTADNRKKQLLGFSLQVLPTMSPGAKVFAKKVDSYPVANVAVSAYQQEVIFKLKKMIQDVLWLMEGLSITMPSDSANEEEAEEDYIYEQDQVQYLTKADTGSKRRKVAVLTIFQVIIQYHYAISHYCLYLEEEVAASSASSSSATLASGQQSVVVNLHSTKPLRTAALAIRDILLLLQQTAAGSSQQPLQLYGQQGHLLELACYFHQIITQIELAQSIDAVFLTELDIVLSLLAGTAAAGQLQQQHRYSRLKKEELAAILPSDSWCQGIYQRQDVDNFQTIYQTLLTSSSSSLTVMDKTQQQHLQRLLDGIFTSYGYVESKLAVEQKKMILYSQPSSSNQQQQMQQQQQLQQPSASLFQTTSLFGESSAYGSSRMKQGQQSVSGQGSQVVQPKQQQTLSKYKRLEL